VVVAVEGGGSGLGAGGGANEGGGAAGASARTEKISDPGPPDAGGEPAPGRPGTVKVPLQSGHFISCPANSSGTVSIF
jgi:hypothetical protein